jgi:hypothetical protein
MKTQTNTGTVKMTVSWAALAAQQPATSVAAPESEPESQTQLCLEAKPLKKSIELPPFVFSIQDKIWLKKTQKGEKPVLGKHYKLSPSVFQCKCFSCKERKMSPCFASVDDLRMHLAENEDVNRGFTFVQCPDCLPKGFDTLVGTTPACLSEHCRKHHKDVLTSLGLNPKKHSPVLLCMDCKEYTPFQHKHCYQCPKDSGCGFLAFKDQKELVAHLKEAHPRPVVKSFSKTKSKGKAPAKGEGKASAKAKAKVTISQADVEAWPELGSKPEPKAKAEDKVLGSGFLKKKAPHERKQTLDLQGSSLSSKNAFASLASASDDEDES